MIVQYSTPVIRPAQVNRQGYWANYIPLRIGRLGPGGFSVLEILAFGDFSYQGHFARDTLLLCRDKPSGSLTDPYSTEDVTPLTFRNMRKTDRALWDLLKRNADFLEACPIDPVLDD